MPDSTLMPLFKCMLRHPGFTQPNSICHWLGNGDVQSVVRRLVINDVEITDAPHYSRWLASRWGIERTAKANKSRKFITVDRIEPDDAAYIETIIAEDRLVYALLAPQIARSPDHAITGTALTGIDGFN